MTLFIGILEEGLIYAIMALGVYITYKILDFPDLSVDSTFPMGAALTASAILGGINPVLTLFLAFGAGALAGCIYCQHKGFFEISVGTGTMVIGLANVIIGTQLLKRFSFIKSTTAVIVGSIVYKACVSFAISKGMTFGLEANDLKLITAVLFLIILVVSTERRKKVKERA